MRANWINTRFGFTAAMSYALGLPVLLVWLSGNWRWVRGWICYSAWIALMLISFLWMRFKDPALLAERARWPGRGGQSRSDLAILLGVKVVWLAWMVLPPLEVRFDWTPRLPLWCAICGGVLVAGGSFLMFRAFTDNTYASQVVRIQADRGHRVVDTGVYGIVRHPMYLGASLLMIGGSLVLGSVAGLLTCMVMIFLMVLRIFGEERTLVGGLEGYEAYRGKVRYRLLPHVW
jgi:protein-S-isoprenylcysteine O-methyltransferase Ste14